MTGSSSSSRPLEAVRETFGDFWRDRPIRPRVGGKFGGVSAAIGSHYRIDPVMVRIAFVVGAFFGGSGLVLYLLGWLVLPKEGRSESGDSVTEHNSTATVVLLVLLLAMLVWGVFDFSGLCGLFLGFTALYLLQRNRLDKRADQHDAGAPQPPAEASSGEDSTDRTADPASAETTSAASAEASAAEQPPSWDPLGTAPFAWDLPEPSAPEPPPEPQPPRRRWVSFLVLGLATLAALLTLPATWAPDQAAAVALGVLGAGMVLAAFLRAGRALVVIALPLAVITIVLSMMWFDGPWRGVSHHSVTPPRVESLQPHYGTSVGAVELDLTELSLRDEQRAATEVEVGMGGIVIELPPEVDVTASCSSDRGRVQCLAPEQEGQHVSSEATDFGTDGPGGGHIKLDLRVDTGEVEVQRG